MNYFILAAFVATAAISGLTGAHLKEQAWQAKWNTHIAADAKALNRAVADARADEKRIAAASQKVAVKAAAADRKIETHTRTLTKEVPVYVTTHQDAVGCVTYGLVRLHDAAVLGVDPATLELPPGVTDDGCSPVKPSDLGRAIIDNYGAARRNAEQLIGLIADITTTIDLYNGDIPQ